MSQISAFPGKLLFTEQFLLHQLCFVHCYSFKLVFISIFNLNLFIFVSVLTCRLYRAASKMLTKKMNPREPLRRFHLCPCGV